MANLVKAFNVLPRIPTWMLCNALGADPVLGCNGFPEGDPLSCVAIAAIAIGFDCWMQVKSPGCVPTSYVDNWEQQFASLRASAVRGLHLDKPGTNSMLLLGLHFHPIHDPDFFAFWHTLLDFRRLQNEQEVQIDLQWVLGELQGRFPPGPLWVFFHGCLRIHWSWNTEQGLLEDRIGFFSLWRISLNELEFRAVFAWQGMICTLCQQRRGFAGLATADAQLSQGSHLQLTDTQRGLLRTAHDGTFFTQDGLKYSTPDGSEACVHCCAADSIDHRIWMCPKFQVVRGQLSDIRPPDCDSLPEWTRLYCWMQAPQEYIPFLQRLQNLRWSRLSQVTRWIYLRTVAVSSHSSRLRLAAWAVVQGHCCESGSSLECLAGGPVHGLWQTSGRAEIIAVLAAVRIGIRSGRRTRIWSDRANVVNKLQMLLEDPASGRPNAHDADLWDLLAIELRREHQITVHKVAAHVDGQVYGPVEEWARCFNDMADQYKEFLVVTDATGRSHRKLHHQAPLHHRRRIFEAEQGTCNPYHSSPF